MKPMMTTIRNLLTNNFLLKIAALIFAAVIWITVVNVNDPTKTVTIYNVPIRILDEKIITDNNQVYTVNSKMTVNVTVSGRRSVISELTENSFSATASFKQMSATNALPVNVKLKYALDKKVSIDNQSQTSISVEIEDLIKKSYDIETNIIGETADNYLLGDVSLARNEIDVTAPESIHQTIAQVRVDVDVTGVQNNIDEKYNIRLYNEKGERIKPDSDNRISLSKNKVTVTATVNKLKKVPVIYELTGMPRGGYDV
ncbi:MAG: hypothetical protein IKN54_05505, partial [Lachnospiraceae bacterium]|nr:hypothetical protein [Lachnospiraceae bacterium]